MLNLQVQLDTEQLRLQSASTECDARGHRQQRRFRAAIALECRAFPAWASRNSTAEKNAKRTGHVRAQLPIVVSAVVAVL